MAERGERREQVEVLEGSKVHYGGYEWVIKSIDKTAQTAVLFRMESNGPIHNSIDIPIDISVLNILIKQGKPEPTVIEPESRGVVMANVAPEQTRGVVTGTIEVVEVPQKRYFDNVNDFDEILNLIVQASPGSLRDSSDNEISALEINRAIVELKALKARRGDMTEDLMLKFTVKNGLREAVVRAMAPDFSELPGLNVIESVLKWVQRQEIKLSTTKAKNEKGGPLKILFTSDGTEIDIARCLKGMDEVKEYLRRRPATEPFLEETAILWHPFTRKYGMRNAVYKCAQQVAADTSRYSL